MSAKDKIEGEIRLTTEELGVLLVDQRGEVTTVIENHVKSLAPGESLEGLVDTPKILLLGLTLPSKDGDTGGGDGGSGMVLGGEDVAGRPGDLSTESGKGLDENSGLDGPIIDVSRRLQCSKIFKRTCGDSQQSWHP